MARALGKARAAVRKKSSGAPEKVKIVCVSDEERDVLMQEASEYLARTGTRWGASLVCVKPARRGKNADDEKVRADEADRLLAASEQCHRVAMEVGGRSWSSEKLSHHIEELLARGRPIAILIGGPTGLGTHVATSADESWSLSSMTLPHRLAVLMVAEQIYRAHEIARGGPYHKA